MRKLFGIAVAGLFLASFAGNALAEDNGYELSFGASASYTYDFNDPDIFNEPAPPGSASNSLLYASGEQDESFNIDLAQIGIAGQRGPVMYGAKLDFGDLAKLAGDSSDGDVALQEMYLAIEASGLTVTAGRFATPIGYEVLEPWANANISRSLIWNLQPINHDGLTVAGSAGPVDLMVGMVNGFSVNDPLANNPDDEYGFIASIGTNAGGIDLNLAGIYSEEQQANDVFEINGIASGSCGNCRYALEATYLESDPNNSGSSNGWVNTDFHLPQDYEVWDVTAYFGMSPCENWNIDGRLSYTDLEAREVSGSSSVYSSKWSNNIWSATLTGGYVVTEGVEVRAEYRHDESDNDLFADDASSDSPKGSDDVVNLQLLWTP